MGRRAQRWKPLLMVPAEAKSKLLKTRMVLSPFLERLHELSPER